MAYLPSDVQETIARALEEDVGSGDVTTDAVVPADDNAGGRLVARLERLSIPADAPGTRAPAAGAQPDLPAVDLVAEEFVFRGKELGRVEVLAFGSEAAHAELVKRLWIGSSASKVTSVEATDAAHGTEIPDEFTTR